ncbi:hypothetical protein EV138_5684 [Kribbella voronezhensis]|uniref:Uncharacterized protein n=1 Tax=Kribbella voronezhensis TaxID=2512212 RepID=A0A4R7SVA1_9ACTN|nr:hypothetical protein EV138_5684 [Kribbella voronezhensis]
MEKAGRSPSARSLAHSPVRPLARSPVRLSARPPVRPLACPSARRQRTCDQHPRHERRCSTTAHEVGFVELELACGVWRETDSAESEGCALRAASWLRAARCALGRQRTGVVCSPVAGVGGGDGGCARRRASAVGTRQGLTVGERVGAQPCWRPTARGGVHCAEAVGDESQHFTGVVRPPSTIHRPWTCSTRISSSQRVGVFGGSALLPLASTVVAFFVS